MLAMSSIGSLLTSSSITLRCVSLQQWCLIRLHFQETATVFIYSDTPVSAFKAVGVNIYGRRLLTQRPSHPSHFLFMVEYGQMTGMLNRAKLA